MNAQSLDMAAAEALLGFWRDAGVDACFEAAPVDRTAVVAPAPPASRAPGVVTSLRVAAAEPVEEARRLAAAAHTLDELAQAVAAFEGCPLRSMGARQSVFARGDAKGALMVVGEGPGAEEDARGQPFVGEAGRLLDRILAAGGLLDRAFITNTVFWRPPGDRAPTPQEQAICAPFLERAFALLQPRAVLLVGGSSAKAVLKTNDGVMRIRGQWREWRLAEGDTAAPAMTTLHPAFLLRQPQAKGLVWRDVLALAARLNGEKVEPNA